MIVVARSYGQLGNRLFLYAHLIAAARQYQVSLANPCFAEYAHLFPATATDLWCRYPKIPSAKPAPSLATRKRLASCVYAAASTMHALRLRQFPYHILRLRGQQSCDLASGKFAQLAQQQRPLLVMGWLFRSEPLLHAHRDEICRHFQIHESDQQTIDQHLQPLRDRADILIGVHIRHGDYKTYLNGKYFFSVPRYAKMMHRIREQWGNRRVVFLVCSNTKLQRQDFAGLDVEFGPGQMVTDLYALAATDFLIGPPSTFTGWASFFGNVPLGAMESPDVEINLAPLLGRHAA